MTMFLSRLTIQVIMKGGEIYSQHLHCFYEWLDAETRKFAVQFIFHDRSHGNHIGDSC